MRFSLSFLFLLLWLHGASDSLPQLSHHYPFSAVLLPNMNHEVNPAAGAGSAEQHMWGPLLLGGFGVAEEYFSFLDHCGGPLAHTSMLVFPHFSPLDPPESHLVDEVPRWSKE